MAKMLKQNDSRLAIGLTLLLIGFLFLIDKIGFFGLLPALVRDFVMDWRSFFFYAGVIFLFTKKDKMPGIILVLLGIIFYFNDVFKSMIGLGGKLGDFIVPIIFIVTGAVFVFLARKR